MFTFPLLSARETLFLSRVKRQQQLLPFDVYLVYKNTLLWSGEVARLITLAALPYDSSWLPSTHFQGSQPPYSTGVWCPILVSAGTALTGTISIALLTPQKNRNLNTKQNKHNFPKNALDIAVDFLELT